METDNTFYAEYRDHVIHTIYVFLLGYYIYIKNGIVNNVINKKINEIKQDFNRKSKLRDNETEESSFMYMWTFISIFHDYGYVFENDDNNKKILLYNELVNNENKNNTKLKTSFDNEVVINYLNDLEILGSKENGFDLIKEISDSTKLSAEGCNGVKNYLKLCLNEKKDRPTYLDHGIMSSLLFLKLSNIIFLQKNQTNDTDFNWDENIQTTFFKYVAQAIAVHNIYVNIFDKNIYEKYQLNLGGKDSEKILYKIDLNKDPFAYLLALCDDLQCWDRKKTASLDTEQNELTSKHVKLQIEPNNIFHFFYYINSRNKKVQTMEELSNYLDNIKGFINKTVIQIN